MDELDVVKKSLKNCQVITPLNVVSFVWDTIQNYRTKLDKVVDFGAGDGRFAIGGNYNKYIGVEIDRKNKPIKNFPDNAKLNYGCILDIKDVFDACVGNPPYYRHHNITSQWRKKAIKIISEEYNGLVNELCNLFVYFMWMSLFRTKDDGIIGLIVPYEWVSRPSVKSLREFIIEKKWNVDVYRFSDIQNIFPRVLTTASLTIIDKSKSDGKWKYFNVDKNFHVKPRRGKTGTGKRVLPYVNGGIIKAHRGFSPGSRKIFALTEGERIHHGIKKEDVVPCVTSFKIIPQDLTTLNRWAFKKYFIDKNAKCWLIRTEGKLSTDVNSYLKNIPEDWRNNWTCQDREIWYAYKTPKIPQILYSAGFVKSGPKIMKNTAKVVAVGSISGIMSDKKIRDIDGLINYLKSFDFASRVVHHAGSLRKIEVKQMNGVISQYYNKVTVS